MTSEMQPSSFQVRDNSYFVSHQHPKAANQALVDDFLEKPCLVETEPLCQRVQLVKGNILSSKMHTLVNTINCVGVMGKGIALTFKHAYPQMFQNYKARCTNKEVSLGKPYCYEVPSGKIILNFPTKGHWRESSKLINIELGLKFLLSHYKEWGIRSIAFPPLGCTNGGLSWQQVKPLIEHCASKMDIPVEIFEPFRPPSKQPEVRKRKIEADESNTKQKQRKIDSLLDTIQPNPEKVVPLFSNSPHDDFPKYPRELHCITTIHNLKLILAHGIQSEASCIEKKLHAVTPQSRKSTLFPPNPLREKNKKPGLNLTQYVTLYITAHNATLYSKCYEEGLCVLRIDPKILEHPETLFSTRAVSAKETEFIPASRTNLSKPMSMSPTSTRILFDKYCFRWGQDQKRQDIRQAEVLIPHEVHPSYVRGVYVRTDKVKGAIMDLFDQICPIPIDIHPTLFPLKKEHKDFTKSRKEDIGVNPLDLEFIPQKMRNDNFPDVVETNPTEFDLEKIEQN